MRRLYNESDLKTRHKNGELVEYLDHDNAIGAGKAKQVRNATADTRSQYVLCLDKDGSIVFEVHRYLNPDRTLAGSGKNDPKRVTINRVTYKKARGSEPKRLTNRDINRILNKQGLAAAMTYLYWCSERIQKWYKTAFRPNAPVL